MSFNTSQTAITNMPLSKLITMRSFGGDNGKDLVAEKIFKPVSVLQRTGKYYDFGNEHLALEDTTQGNRGIANEVNSEASLTGTYSVVDHGLKEFISDSDMEENPADMREDFKVGILEKLAIRLLVRKEKDAADKLFNTTTFASYSSGLTGTDKWSDPTSNPFDSIYTAMTSIRDNAGHEANYCVMSRDVWNALKKHPEVLARLQVTINRVLTPDIFKDLLDDGTDTQVGNILIGKESYKDSSGTLQKIWGSGYFFLGYVDPSTTTKRNYTVAKNFTMASNSNPAIKISSFKQSPEEKGMWYKAETSFDHRIVAASAGFLIYNAI